MKPKKPTPNPQPHVPIVRRGGNAYAVATALDSAPKPSRTTVDAFDALPAKLRKQARRQIAAWGGDGWFNPETMLGVEGSDPSTSTGYRITGPVDFATLEAIARSEGVAKKCINIPIQQMLRRLPTIKGEADNATINYLKRKGYFSDLEKLAYNGDLFGGAIGVMLFTDGTNDLEQPLNLDAIKSYDGMNVFDRWQVAWYTADLERNPMLPNFMMPKRYHIFPIYGAPFWVHHTRIQRWDGAFLTERARQSNNGWHDSELQPIIKKLVQLGEAMGYSRQLIRTLVVQVLAMDGLGELIKSGNRKTVEARFQALRRWLSNQNILPIDAKDKYEKSSSSIQGVAILLDRFMQWFAADGPVPFSVLYGKLTGSIGGGKDDDVQLRMFYDGIRHKQTTKAAPLIEYAVVIARHAEDSEFEGDATEVFEIDFPALTEPTEKEVADTRYAVAQADEIYINLGVFDAEEIREVRASGDHYSPEYTIKPGSRPKARGVPEAVGSKGAEPAAGGAAGA